MFQEHFMIDYVIEKQTDDLLLVVNFLLKVFVGVKVLTFAVEQHVELVTLLVPLV